MLNFLGLIGVAAILAQAPSAQGKAKVYPDRAKFAAQMAKVLPRSAMAEVELLLGRPENIRRSASGEVWEYGVEGTEKVPTLGTVRFVNGEVDHASWGGEPPTSVISERELRSGILKLCPVSASDIGLLHSIRSVNYLRRLGASKARAILSESSRVLGGDGDYYLPLIADALFETWKGSTKPGEFTISHPWAVYSVSIVDGVPFPIQQILAEFTGPSPSLYLHQYPTDASVRASDLVPSDDPIASLIKLLRSREWQNQFPVEQRSPRPHFSAMIKEVLGLVKTAFRSDGADKLKWDYFDDPKFSYRPADNERLDKEVLKNLEKLHAEYKEAGVHWDAKRQLYVRRDGSYDKVTEPNPRRAATTQPNQP